MAGRIDQSLSLDQPISDTRYAQGTRLQGLQKLGITTIRELLVHYPLRYNDFSEIVSLARAPLGEVSSVMGTVDEVKVKRIRKRMVIVELSLVDDSGVMLASWFNQPWIAKTLTQGTRVLLRGKMTHSYGYRKMSAPLYTIIAEDVLQGGVLPVYPANAQVTSNWIARIIQTALEARPALLDPLPVALRVEQGFMSRHAALLAVHQPESTLAFCEARRRLAFEEVYLLQLHLMLTRKLREQDSVPFRHATNGVGLKAFERALPFTLTADQAAAVASILDDMGSDRMMNRLLMGDVGSGKTVVAASALAAAYDSGTQAAMMAPTEVLAEQYALKLGPLFDVVGIPWALLTSSTTTSERRRMLQALDAGTISVVFGTHALIEPDVHFCALSLVVIDEQQRFGVEQRAALHAKGKNCDILAMTATPIPRSLALTIYGDLETSFIRTRPIATVQTVTEIIPKSEMHLAYEGIREALDRGEQAYIVCPLISNKAPAEPSADEQDDETLPASNLITEFSDEQDSGSIKAAEEELLFLRRRVFPERTVALMTSHLKPPEKRAVMDDFRAGRIDILVSTTVIEVGIDVPNATVMVIQDADRFGLSQLHQLRGRVGRGEKDGAVYLVTAALEGEAGERLRALKRSSDGFELAEQDLRLRHEGDVLGSRQHGAAALRLVNVVRDAQLIADAHAQARALLDTDPLLALPVHAHLRYELAAVFGS